MSKRNVISLIVMLCIGIYIFGYSIHDINLGVLKHEFFAINWWWMLVALACILLYFGLEAVVTKILVDRDGVKNFSFRDAIRVPLVEQLFNGITPFSSGGQPGQLIVMIRSGVDGGRASSVLLMKFVVFQGTIVINFLISLIIGFHYIAEKMSYLSLFVIFGFIIHLFVISALLLIMYWYSFTRKLVLTIIAPLKLFLKPKHYASIQATLDEKITTFHNESVKLARKWRLILKIFLVTFLQLFFYYLIPYFIMLSLGIYNANIIMVISLHVLIFMIISLFPIPGGSGGAEYSFEMLFKSYMSNNSELVLAMILWRFLTYYLGIFLGIIAFMMKSDKIKKR
ncbi:phosphatidylglycerol lysyltransferase [Philodulcilactobacillus myokoensis]|uniref:Phosphatidylglycerol lysyltransferase n=1 Tax=Philodulcilactobacillus myokoensis TaxID=2929573 RepID=A0A9W6B234_9LACO|nr:lysylphosphatidylglycerol synthase transmembrane domain-containing protein [Philodulcilactobacillus myokoensis]GLB47040.1 phosphatidylglycerol lysyltransferase [Philodulcilactobacillus myokoensis]